MKIHNEAKKNTKNNNYKWTKLQLLFHEDDKTNNNEI